MKVLLISNMYPSKEHPYYGVFVSKFVEFMSAEGVDIEKAVIYGKRKSVIGKIFSYLKFAMNVWSALLKDDHDLIYVHYINHSLLPIYFARFLIRKPLVVNAHGSDVLPASKYGKFTRNLVTQLVHDSVLVVVPSLYFSRIVRDAYGLARSKIFVSPSGGVDTSLFVPARDGKTSGKFVVGYVSRLDEGKGWNVFLEALAFLKRNNFLVEAIVAGGGGEQEKFLHKVRELSLESSVSYIGPQAHGDLPDVFRSMDVFVFPTESESLGLVGLEAMASGLPVIGSNVAALPGYINPGVNGQLFEVGDVTALAELIQDYARMDFEAYRVIKGNARQTSVEFDSKRVAGELFAKLESLVS